MWFSCMLDLVKIIADVTWKGISNVQKGKEAA